MPASSRPASPLHPLERRPERARAHPHGASLLPPARHRTASLPETMTSSRPAPAPLPSSPCPGHLHHARAGKGRGLRLAPSCAGVPSPPVAPSSITAGFPFLITLQHDGRSFLPFTVPAAPLPVIRRPWVGARGRLDRRIRQEGKRAPAAGNTLPSGPAGRRKNIGCPRCLLCLLDSPVEPANCLLGMWQDRDVPHDAGRSPASGGRPGQGVRAGDRRRMGRAARRHRRFPARLMCTLEELTGPHPARPQTIPSQHRIRHHDHMRHRLCSH